MAGSEGQPAATDPRFGRRPDFGVEEQVDRLIRECEAMGKWAADRGSTPAPWAVETTVYARVAFLATQAHSGNDTNQQFDVARILRADDRNSLVSAHRHLSGLVHPARPQTILRLAEESHLRSRLVLFFGPLPIVRRLVVASLVLLVAFVLFASSASVRSSTSSSIASTSSTSTIFASSTTTVRP